MTFQTSCFALIKSGICKADCCGPIPIEFEIIERNKAMIQVPYKDLADGSDQNELAYPMSEDLSCIFLNRETHLCEIYNDRPWLCRKFGDATHPTMTCPHLKALGKMRTRSERKRIVRAHSDGWKTTLGKFSKIREEDKKALAGEVA